MVVGFDQPLTFPPSPGTVEVSVGTMDGEERETQQLREFGIHFRGLKLTLTDNGAVKIGSWKKGPRFFEAAPSFTS